MGFYEEQGKTCLQPSPKLRIMTIKNLINYTKCHHTAKQNLFSLSMILSGCTTENLNSIQTFFVLLWGIIAAGQRLSCSNTSEGAPERLHFHHSTATRSISRQADHSQDAQAMSRTETLPTFLHLWLNARSFSGAQPSAAVAGYHLSFRQPAEPLA